jgi:hypothetical protein
MGYCMASCAHALPILDYKNPSMLNWQKKS